ncbi:MAG: hypothetical protein ACJASM_002509 [Salibacteraceae bacterium]|jgi:hypothetical protein
MEAFCNTWKNQQIKMNVKKIIGIILMTVAVLIFLLMINSVIFLYSDPELEKWIMSSAIGFLILFVLTFFLFRFGRKWYRNKEAEEIRGDILDTSDMLAATALPISKYNFRMKPEGFEEVKSGMIKRSIPIGILAIGGGLAISFFKSSSSGDFDWNVLLIMIPVSLLAIGYGFKQGVDRQRQIFESYVLSIHETTIERKAFNTPDIMMAHANINAILKNKDGSFLIKSATSKDIIGIIAQIERKDELEKLLNEIHPVTSDAPISLIEKYRTLLTILPVGLMVVTFLSTHKWIVGIAGILLLVALGYSFFEIQRNKNVDEKTRKASWWLILVVIPILASMYTKIIMG